MGSCTPQNRRFFPFQDRLTLPFAGGLTEIETIYRAYQVLLLKRGSGLNADAPCLALSSATWDFCAERKRSVKRTYFAGPFGGSAGVAGLTNFASSTGTFCFTSLSWIVKRPLGRASVQR